MMNINRFGPIPISTKANFLEASFYGMKKLNSAFRPPHQ